MANNRLRPAATGIAVVSAYYPSHGGGIELATRHLVQDLLAGGWCVRWLAQQDGELPDLQTPSCRPLRGTDLLYRLSGIPLPFPYPSAIGRIWGAVGQSAMVVIAEANFPVSVLAYAIARFRSRKVLLVQHVGQPSTVSPVARRVMKLGELLFARRMVRNADAVVYVSPAVATHFSAVRTSGATTTIGHAIDTGLFTLPDGIRGKQSARENLGLPQHGKLACIVGRITPSKGAFVIRALAAHLPGWTFAFAGSGPIDPAQWGLPNVVALGQLDRSAIAQLYRASDALVLASQSESFSLVVREAMASGCRVVCGEQILETDSGLEGFVETAAIDLSDPAATAARFAALLESEPKAAAPAMRSYVVERCSPEANRAAYGALVERLADTAGR